VYQAELESLPVATSALKPQINFSAQGSTRELDLATTGENTINSTGYSLNLVQSIYNGVTLATVDATEANIAKALAEFEVSKQDLMLRVAERYFTILAAQDNLDFAVAEENAIARQLDQATKRFEVGLIAITDVLEAQARFDTAVAQSLLAENLLDNANQALQVIIAQAPSETPAKLGDRLELVIPEPANSQQWVDMSLQNNQRLIAALAALQAADFERQRTGKSRYPTVDLTASYSDSSIDDDIIGDLDQEDLTLMIQLDVPLFTGGRISAERQQAEANYQSAQSTALLQKRLTSEQTRNAYLGVVFGISQVKALKQALASSTTALEATEAGFDVGTRTSVDVLISLRETFRAQRDYASARYDYLINTLKLKQATGLLSADDLEQINLWLF
jgi:outer membrane protein